MDQDISAGMDDRDAVESGQSDTEEMPEPEEWVRKELERIAEKARQMEAEGTEEPRALAADVGDEAEEAQAEAAGEEAPGSLEDAPAVAEAAGAEAEPVTPEEAERVADEAREAMPEPVEEVRGIPPMIEPHTGETADDIVRATRERIAVAEERSMAPEYRGISFGDGFRFGCGFTVAGCLFWLILSILLAAIPLALSAFNVIGLPGR